MKSNLPVIRIPSGSRIWTGLAYQTPCVDMLTFQLLNGHGEAVADYSMDGGTLSGLPRFAPSVSADEAEEFEAFGRAAMDAQGKRVPLVVDYYYATSPGANAFNGGKGFFGIQSGKAGPLLAIADSEADALAFVAGVNR